MKSDNASGPAGPDWETIERDFESPPLCYRPRPLWFWNNTTVTDDGIREQIAAMRDRCGYGGFGIVPFGRAFAPDYLGDEYFARYRTVLETARELGMTVSLYDEYGFPSGSVGSRNSSDESAFAKAYPDRVLHRLDKIERMVTGPARVEVPLPEGTVEAVVAMDATGGRRVVVEGAAQSAAAARRVVAWNAPDGIWRLMVFVCVLDDETICDYLDPVATRGFIELTHEAYYEHFAEHFGTTIDSTFHDEPTLYRALGRTWTPGLADAYRERYGEDPAALYPALWYDIGEQTAGARHRLFSLRSELFATGFAGTIQAWATEHGITATGHQDQEEIENPVSVAGDLMKCFRDQEVPGIDKIGGDRPAELFYKVISSAAYNWDHSLVMSETYGAMGDIGWDEVYTVALEQYSSGINMLIPHAVWYDPTQVVFLPELSWRNPLYADALPSFTAFLTRLNLMLQNDGRQLCDVAVLYPIDGLEAAHHFDGELGPYRGGVPVPESNYVEIGRLIHNEFGLDYRFLHPDVVEQRCRVDSAALEFDGSVHPERFPVLVLPASRAVRPGIVDAVERLLKAGGAVIAVGELPSASTDPWADPAAADRLAAMFDEYEHATALDALGEVGAPGPDHPLHAVLTAELTRLVGRPDARVNPPHEARVMHKRYRGRDVYLLANLAKEPRELRLETRESHVFDVWNPHDGSIETGADEGHEVVVRVATNEARLVVAR